MAVVLDLMHPAVPARGDFADTRTAGWDEAQRHTPKRPLRVTRTPQHRAARVGADPSSRQTELRAATTTLSFEPWTGVYSYSSSSPWRSSAPSSTNCRGRLGLCKTISKPSPTLSFTGTVKKGRMRSRRNPLDPNHPWFKSAPLIAFRCHFRAIFRQVSTPALTDLLHLFAPRS